METCRKLLIIGCWWKDTVLVGTYPEKYIPSQRTEIEIRPRKSMYLKIRPEQLTITSKMIQGFHWVWEISFLWGSVIALLIYAYGSSVPTKYWPSIFRNYYCFIIFLIDYSGGHPFSTYAKFSEKLTFLTSW